MNEKLLEPLKYYESCGKEEHARNAAEYFDALLAESRVDVEENRNTVKKYDTERDTATKIRQGIKKKEMLRALSIAGIVLSVVLFLIGIYLSSEGGSGAVLLMVAAGVLLPLCIVSIIRLKPKIKAANELFLKHEAEANKYLAEANAQMAPLNALFDNTDTFRLIEKTVPDIEFDPCFTMDNYDLFRDKYDFIDLQGKKSSVVDTVSGRLCGNPFLLCKSLLHEMGTKTYMGTKVISWTETYRDSDGKMRTRTRTQTLTATVTKPFPEYEEKTYLCYGSQAAPDLSFDRTPKHTERLSERQIERRVNRGEQKLKKKAERSMRKGGSFQEMANSEFDVLFGADNRDHEVQFRLMYTPLAQQNTVDLMTSKTGYGDDFHFNKRHRFNMITSEHAQGLSLDTSSSNYRSHSVDLARDKFIRFNSEFFKSLFFDFAPLLSVPAYLEEPCASLEPPEEYSSYYTSYEHEVMANALGEREFAHEATATRAILNTSLIGKDKDGDRVAVTALSFAREPRMDFVPVLGGDGRLHSVPVPWDEYIPLEWTRTMLVGSAPASEREIRGIDKIPGGAYFHGMCARTL